MASHLSTEGKAQILGRIQSLRTLRGLSDDKDFIEAVRLPRSTVRDLLSGTTADPSIGVLLHIAYGLDLRSVEELVTPLGTMWLARRQFGDEVVE